jgi:hypothetical protein
MIKKRAWIVLMGLFIILVGGCSPGAGQVEVTAPPQPATETAVPETTSLPTQTPTATTEPATATAEPSPTMTPPATAEPATATAEPSPTVIDTALPVDAEEFIDSLKLVIAGRDFTAMQSLMADPFAIGVWLSEISSYSPGEAIAAFQDNNLLPEGAQITWADPDLDLEQILGQPPPSNRPFAEVAAALYSYGWGEDGSGETILFIVRQPDGSYRWESILVSALGYIGFPTDVTSVTINAAEATFYSGPDESYEPVATVFGGQSYPVISVSADNLWWRLRCFDDNDVPIPQCWVSADTAVTSPNR